MQILTLANRLFPSLENGKSQVTIRKEHRNIDIGPLVIENSDGSDNLIVDVSRVEHMTFAEISDEDIRRTGAPNRNAMLDQMCRAYMHMHEDTPCTVISWVYRGRPKTGRSEIFEAIDEERAHQQEAWPEGESELSLGDSILLMESYVQQAREEWRKSSNEEEARCTILKSIAIGVRALEQQGLVRRADLEAERTAIEEGA